MLDPLEPKPPGGGQQLWPGAGGESENKGFAAEIEAQGGAGGATGPAESKRSSEHGDDDHCGGESDEKVRQMYSAGATLFTCARLKTNAFSRGFAVLIPNSIEE